MKKLVATLLATILLTVNASALGLSNLSIGVSGGKGVFAADALIHYFKN